MTAFTLGEATARALGRVRPSGLALFEVRSDAARPGAGRSRSACRHAGAPVRRDSLEAGSFEDAFFAVPAKGETDRLVRTARAALDAGRRLKRAARVEGRSLSAAERALASLTAGAVRVYEELCMLARVNRGRVYPSYDHLAAATALGRATIARALACLEAAGFLVRQRRFRRVVGEGQATRYKQTSNVYRATLPQRLLGHLPRWLRTAPAPDDARQRLDEHAADAARMREGLNCRELAEATVGGALGRMLARLGSTIDRHLQAAECESHDDPQTQPDSLDIGACKHSVACSQTGPFSARID